MLAHFGECLPPTEVDRCGACDNCCVTYVRPAPGCAPAPRRLQQLDALRVDLAREAVLLVETAQLLDGRYGLSGAVLVLLGKVAAAHA